MVRDMTHGSPFKLILSFWFPMLLGNLVQQVYNLADSIIVGRFVGVKAFAGVSATGSLNFMILGFLLGMCSGCAIPVAQAFGEPMVMVRTSRFSCSIILLVSMTLFLLIQSPLAHPC